MKKLITICVVVTLILAVSGVAQATLYTYDVGPGDLVDGPTFANGQGGEPFGYDHGPSPAQGPPIGVEVAGPTGFGSSSFWSNVQGSAAGGGRDYTSLRLSPKDIFGMSDVTVGQLSSISYWTKQQFSTNDLAWQVKIYTEGDPGNWYGVNIELTKPTYSDTDWHLNSTDDNLNIYKTVLKDTGFDDLDAGTFADAVAEYGTEKILFIDVIAGWASTSPPVYSYLDGVTLELTTGDTAAMNLVPEPTTICLLGLGGLALRRKRRA